MASTKFAQAIKGIQQGFSEAGEAKRRMDEDERKAALQKRDDQRFEWEKGRATREEAQAKTEDELRDSFLQLENDRKSGTGAFADLVSPESSQPAQPRMAIGGGQTQPEVEAQPKDPVSDFLNPKTESKYADPNAMWNRYYDQLGALMRKQYANKGDFARAAVVDSEIEKLKESGYEKVRRSAVAAAVAGADGQTLEPLLTRAYGTLNDGQSIKPGSVSFDQKSGKYSMTVVGKDGKERNQSYDKMGLAGVLMMADPIKVLEWNTGRADKDREFSLDERRTRAAETTAGAAVTKAKADALKVDGELKASDIELRNKTLSAMFPNAGRVLKPEEMVGMSNEQRQRFDETVSNETTGLAKAQALSALNPRLDPRIAAQVVRNPGAYQVAGEEGGRPYTMVGSQKVFLR